MSTKPSGAQPLLTHAYLMSEWAKEYEKWDSEQDERLLMRLRHWAEQATRKETSAQSSFEQTFFVELWGYSHSGTQSKAEGFTLDPQYPIKNAGQGGGIGQADLAMGWFNHPQLPHMPQILCEFKDVRSGLDSPQNRKGNNRSPVKQCADYLKYAREEHDPLGNQKIVPTWGIVSDMQEFRLYWRVRMPDQYQRFVVADMLAETEQARQQRFLFARIFHSDWLLDRGNGAPLLDLLKAQRVREKALEKTFYFEYRAYRDYLYRTLLTVNPDYKTKPRQLVRLTQKLLDRFLFVLFCEDMGAHLDYPTNLLRNLLIEASNSDSYDPEATDLWGGKVKRLFNCMRDGQPFAGKPINRFNGGLFAADKPLDELQVPDRVFCAPRQGLDEASLLSQKNTLLYFASAYNFGIDDGGERAIGLYTLGRIFEQSITDLEILEAEVADTPSLMKLGKRKTDGVYYTPEWVTAYIVEETLGLRLRELRAELPDRPDEAQVHEDHTKTGKFKSKDRISARYFAALEQHERRVGGIKVLDPACGSGAFLIQALKRLIAEHEWLAGEKVHTSLPLRQSGLFDMARAYREILANNLYGVDVNAESVEITKLALWLHTAMPGKPLSTLDGHIVCGNSLVDSGIEKFLNGLTDEQRSRINPFDYATAFADVFAAGGFDVVIGNPPYIKLQNMRQVQSEATEYWVRGKDDEGLPKFKSAQTGNFDIYLLFIEQGLRLLNEKGRMAFIAPSVWVVNEYGEGLRNLLSGSRQLDRWVDFADFQIFDEAVTYTALQFFTSKVNSGVRLHWAARGCDDLAAFDWSQVLARSYSSLPDSRAWDFMPEHDRLLVGALQQRCKTLADCSSGIMVGIQTSADNVYHLQKVSEGKYLSFARKGAPEAVEIEDELVRPLVSGPEAKRYHAPKTETWLLFPYDLGRGRPTLFSAAEMKAKHPNGWNYLQKHEPFLRGRENGKMDKDGWYGYVYPKNLDKQEIEKLIVAQTVPSMRVCFDSEADFFLNNVRVNGILPKSANGWFLLGVLNSPVADFVFKRIAKVKEGGYYEANKQFIAPLPIPPATPEQEKQVAEKAKALQALHSNYRDKLAALSRRMDASQLNDESKFADWLFGNAVKVDVIRQRAATEAVGLKGAAFTRWVKAEQERALSKALEPLSGRLRPGVKLVISAQGGEVSLAADGVTAFAAYPEADDGDFLAAQWRHKLRVTAITPSVTATKLLDELLKLKSTDLEPLKKQIIALDKELIALEAKIAASEADMNSLIYQLYGLSEEEIRRVEQG